MKYSQKSHCSAGYHNMTVVLFTLLCVLVCGSLSLSLKAQTKTSDQQVTPKSLPGRNGKIVFTGYPDIYTTEADGANVQRLTDSPRYEQSPRWSPDGTKIAFFSKVDNNEEIYVMNADGSNQTRLTNDPAVDYLPIFSPDGTRIAFKTTRAAPNPTTCFISPNCNVEIYVMNADGSNQTRLTNDPAAEYSPAWSPDGSRIAFTRGDHIYVMNADGTNQTRLTTVGAPGGDGYPRWSPDGTKIAFRRFSPLSNNSEIFVMNADGSNQTRLTNGGGSSDASLDWSPDGSRIVFVSSPGNFLNNYEIYVMNADGSNETRLTNNPAYDHSPIFSPDGTRIAFFSDRDQIDNGWDYNFKIYVMNADGSSQTRLTNTADNVNEAELDWHAVPVAANPIDTADFFVRQQYRDFLNREAEPEGLQFYLDMLAGCHPNDAECIRYTRGALSANFLRSPEFGRKGSYVMYLYLVSIGQRPVTAAELPTKNDPALNDRPNYQEFMTDLASISTPNDDLGLTEQKKNDLANNWMTRPQIVSIYGGLSNAQFVQKLIDVSGVTPANQNWVADLNAGARTRAQILRLFAESPEVDAKFFKQSFVTMEYFGYLRRKPEDCHDPANWGGPDPSQCGFIFHNHRFTLHPDPHVIQNIIVRGFIESPEYRRRF